MRFAFRKDLVSKKVCFLSGMTLTALSSARLLASSRFMMASSYGSFSALLVLCTENSPVTCEFPSQRVSNADFDISLMWFCIGCKQSNDRWFETTWRPCDVIVMYRLDLCDKVMFYTIIIGHVINSCCFISGYYCCICFRLLSPSLLVSHKWYITSWRITELR